MDASQTSATSIQEEQSSVSLKAQKFREEQLCAIQTLGDWQQDGYKSYSSFDFSSLNDASTIHTTSAASILDSSISAAILAKKRVLKWQEERSQNLKCSGNGLADKTLTGENSALFKVPLPKPVTVQKLELHEWYFGLRSKNWVLIGKIIIDKGKIRKYTSKSLFQYFERKKSRSIYSLDQTKELILSGPCGLANFSLDQLHHPNYIKDTFRHGFPKNWKEVLNAWSDFELKARPEKFDWPVNTVLNTSTSTISSHFTSVTDRVAPTVNVTEELAKFKIPRNIGVEVDSRYALNKFLSATEAAQPWSSSIAGSSFRDHSNQLLNGAELSIPILTKSQMIIKSPVAAAVNQVPIADHSIPGSSKRPVEERFHEPRSQAMHSLKDHHIESRKNNDITGIKNSAKTSKIHHLDRSVERVTSNETNRSRSSSSQRRDEKSLPEPKATSRMSPKLDSDKSQKNGGGSELRSSAVTSKQHHQYRSGERISSNETNRSRSSLSKRRDEKSMPEPNATSRMSPKMDGDKSQKNNMSELRSSAGTSKQHHLNRGGEKIPSNETIRVRSSSSKNGPKMDYDKSRKYDNSSEPRTNVTVPSRVDIPSRSPLKRQLNEIFQVPKSKDSSKKYRRESDKNDETMEPISLVQTSSSRVGDKTVSPDVLNRSRSRSCRGKVKEVLQSPIVTSSSRANKNHSEFSSQDVEGGSRIPLRSTLQNSLAIETAVQPNILQSLNRIKPTATESSNLPAGHEKSLTGTTLTLPQKENNSKAGNQSVLLTSDNQHFRNLCGKNIDPKCSLKGCCCHYFSDRIMELKLTKIDLTGATEQRAANKTRKLVNATKAADDLSPPRKKNSPLVQDLANWRPVVTGKVNELLLAGDLIDSTGRVVENNHMSCPIRVRRREIFHASDGNRYSLVGRLSSEAKKDMPRDILQKYFKNDLFPLHWKKMLTEWIAMQQHTREATRASTRVRVPPIPFWKVRDGLGLFSDSDSVGQLNEDTTNKKKTKQSGKATKHKENKSAKTAQLSRNHSLSPNRSEPSLDIVETRSKRLHRNHGENPRQESNRSRPRLRRSCQSKSPTEVSYSRSRFEGCFDRKKFRKIRNYYRVSSSETDSDFDDTGNDSSKRAHISKQNQFGERNKSVKHVNSQKLTFKKSRSRTFSTSDSDENYDPNISQPKTAARCRSRLPVAQIVQKDDHVSESDNLPKTLTRNNVEENEAEHASQVHRVEPSEFGSGKSTLLSDHKVVSYPWMSDDEHSSDTDLEAQRVLAHIRLQLPNSRNTEKDHNKIEKSSPYAINSTNFDKQIKATLPVSDVEVSISDFAEISKKVVQPDNKCGKNNSQSIGRSGHCNPGQIQPITPRCQNVDDNSFDNMTISIIFSETDPRAARF